MITKKQKAELKKIWFIYNETLEEVLNDERKKAKQEVFDDFDKVMNIPYQDLDMEGVRKAYLFNKEQIKEKHLSPISDKEASKKDKVKSV